MKRTLNWILGSLALCLLLTSGCGSEKDSAVKARNLSTGDIESFPSAGSVPSGYSTCTDDGCTVPGGTPCENLGPAVCPLLSECRLKELWCSGTASSGSGSSGSGSSGSGSSDPGATGTDPTQKCEYSCIPKLPLLCEELSDEKACIVRADCEWSLSMCPACDAKDRPDLCQCKPSCQTKIAPPPPVPPSVACKSNADCGKAELCLFKSGCGLMGPGACQTRPQACPAVYSPVCGCNGKSYGNECEARAAGTSIAHVGDCTLPPTTGCMSNADCAVNSKSSFCFFKSGCGKTGPGVCQAKPQACPEYWSPVCGCDGKTYGNECEARAMGTSVAAAGECAPPPPPTGCKSNTDCAKNEFCFFKSGCGKLGAGACKVRPQACAMYYSPVCGCDGKTYGNECEAEAAGVSVSAAGACVPNQSTCDSLKLKYINALAAAKTCYPLATTPVAQCANKVTTDIACNTCETYVNDLGTLTVIQKEWALNGCNKLPWACPAMACRLPTGGKCLSSSTGATQGACQDLFN
jgi:hypothetical protein